MLSNRGPCPLVLVGLSSLGLVLLIDPAYAQPWSLPYESQPPFIPIIDLFGSGRSGLKLQPEAEQRINQHHTPDRPSQSWGLRKKGHRAGRPQQ